MITSEQRLQLLSTARVVAERLCQGWVEGYVELVDRNLTFYPTPPDPQDFAAFIERELQKIFRTNQHAR